MGTQVYRSNSISVAVNTCSFSLSIFYTHTHIWYLLKNLSTFTVCWLLCCFDAFCRICFLFFFVCVCECVCCLCVFFFFCGSTLIMQDNICKYINYEPYLTKHRLQHVCNKNWKSKGNSVETENTHDIYTSSKTRENQTTKKYKLFGEALASDPNMFFGFFFVFLVSIFKQPIIPNFFCFLKYVLLQKMWNTKKYSSIVIVHTEGHDREGWHRNHDVSMVNNNDNFASLGVPGWRLHRLACKFSLTQWRY